jgi:hypothetical protein
MPGQTDLKSRSQPMRNLSDRSAKACVAVAPSGEVSSASGPQEANLSKREGELTRPDRKEQIQEVGAAVVQEVCEWLGPMDTWLR